jgi:hypothetical protein
MKGANAIYQAKMLEEATNVMGDTMIKQADQEIAEMDRLMKEGTASEFEKLREKRREALRQKQKDMMRWKQLGHGQYQEIGDEKEWFEESKKNERMVCHFYRKTTENCKVVDKHLAILAQKHKETRFIKIDAEKCHFLVQKFEIVIMPTIVLTKDNFKVDMIEGFDDLGGRVDFSTKDMETRLAKEGVIDYDGDVKERLKEAKKKKSGFGFSRQNPEGRSIYGKTRKVYDSDSD